jgi:CubicO group peptidase (beta-lactamase class C family)
MTRSGEMRGQDPAVLRAGRCALGAAIALLAMPAACSARQAAQPPTESPAASTEATAKQPMASVRVAFDRNGITASSVTGFADVAAGRAVTADDPVRIASISKLVATLGVMRLVEQRKLDLDADVSQLLGWPLRHPQFPDVPITLRLLLSHRAGLTDKAGYWQIPLDGSLRELLADPRAWDKAHAPGTFWRYANVGFPLVAAVMERATGERFDRLMDRLVLRPLGIAGCYNWDSCDEATASRAVVLYSDGKPVRDDNHGHKPACAVNAAKDGSCDLARWRAGENGALFSPQGGLRISMNGLAKIGRLLLGQGTVDGVQLLSPQSLRTMATPLWSFAPGNGIPYEEDDDVPPPALFPMCRYGLATITLATGLPGCGDDPFGDGRPRIGHSGSAYGLVSGLWVDPASGTGVAYFTTGMDDAPAGRHSAFRLAVEDLLTQRN